MRRHELNVGRDADRNRPKKRRSRRVPTRRPELASAVGQKAAGRLQTGAT